MRQPAERARKRALSDLNYVHVLSQRFRIRKRRASDMRTCDHGLWWLWLLELVHLHAMEVRAYAKMNAKIAQFSRKCGAYSRSQWHHRHRERVL